MTYKLPPEKFEWKLEDLTIIPPDGFDEMIKKVKSVQTVGELERVLPECEAWMSENPGDLAVAAALIEAVGRV